ncbi:MAG: DUF4465 domain-containing protein [Bacteroidota bacterium]
MRTTKTLLLLSFTIFLWSAFTKDLKAQTIADFENLPLVADTFWNGSDGSGVFASGNASFVNKFVDWGGGFTSWSGFSYSDMRDTTTQVYTNEFSAMTALGYNNSDKYAVCYVSSYDPLPVVRLNGIAHGDSVSGFFITNSTYSYLTMKNGGGPAKKFGGVSGTDPDWFALSVYGYKDGVRVSDSVLFYLADYRFTNSSEDYIVKDWRWVDLTPLGRLDSLEFKMYSSDTGNFGINNPTYFCLDNLITNHNSSAGLQEHALPNYSVYPNPAEDVVIIQPFSKYTLVRVCDLQGKQLPLIAVNGRIDISSLTGGVYLLQIQNGNSVFYSKFAKK